MLGNALCLLHLDLFRDGFEHIASFDDAIRMWKKLHLSFRHLSIRASFVIRHSKLVIFPSSASMRSKRSPTAFWRASSIRRARRGGIVLVERTVELAHKAPLVLGQVQQRTVNQDLTDGRGNNALALTEVLVKAREMRSNHPCSRKLTASRRAFASASSKEALNTPP